MLIYILHELHLLSKNKNKRKDQNINMDLPQTLVLLVFSFSITYVVHIMLKQNSSKFPPGPKPFPIIGNILDLGQKPHQSLAKLSKIYGPLMLLKLGSTTTIVVSSPEIAKTMLQKHDNIFSDRAVPEAIRAPNHHKFSVVWLPADHQWRKLRKICKERMFSSPRLDASQGLRMEKVHKLREFVENCCESGEALDIGRAAFVTSLNLMSTTLFSLDLAAYNGNADNNSYSSQEFKDIMWGIMEYVGKPNLADYFPILKHVDPQGICRKSRHYFERCMKIFDNIISERESSNFTPRNDMLEALLELNKKNGADQLSLDDIKHMLLDLFVAGTETSSSTVEWALTELMRNPEKMLKAQKELRNIIGHNEQVQESDISRLPYLQAVIKETFRLHPAIPMLVPHKAGEDVEINGYIVPKNAQILINVWAIGKDSSLWSEPDSFMPERFLEREIDFRGQHFELIPFGAGRRICVGLPLAYRMVHLVVATLVHNFEWKLEEGLKPGDIDVDEKFGITLQKAIPLKAVPFKL